MVFECGAMTYVTERLPVCLERTGLIRIALPYLSENRLLPKTLFGDPPFAKEIKLLEFDCPMLPDGL